MPELFCICTQPMRDNVTMYHCLSLAGCICKMIPDYDISWDVFGHFGKFNGISIKYPKLLTHWGRVTHICASKLTIIGPNNGLSPGRCQAIVWTNAGILLIGPLVTNFSESLIEIHIFLLKKMHMKMSSGKWWPFCLSLNVLSSQRIMSVTVIVIAATDGLALLVSILYRERTGLSLQSSLQLLMD